MAQLIEVTLTNNSPDSIVLEPVLGGWTIAPAASKTLVLNKYRLKHVALDSKSDEEVALAALLESPITVIGADSGSEAAGAAVYSGTAQAGLKAGTFRVQIPEDGGGYITMVDDGLGVLEQDGGAGTGTINYITGAWTVANDITVATIAAEGAILLDYVYNNVTANFGPYSSTLNDDSAGNKLQAELEV